MRNPSPERDAFLRDVLRYFTRNGAAGLQEMMRSGSPELACGAAHLLLDGHEFGAWRARPSDLRLARKLLTAPKPVVKSKREAKPMKKAMQPLKWSDLGPTAKKSAVKKPVAKSRVAAVRRVLEARHRMNTTCADPKASARMKITAIREFVVALDASGMGDVVPNYIRDGLAAHYSKEN